MTVPSLIKRHGRRGTAHLRIAVLEVLYQADECIGAGEISVRADIFREAGFAYAQGNDHLVHGVIQLLVRDGMIEKCTQPNRRGGWKLTDEARAERDEVMLNIPDWGGDKRLIASLRARQWGFCPGCLAVLPKPPHVDHVKAKAVGGSDTPENKQLLCQNCNTRKNKKSWEQFLAERWADGDENTDYAP